MLPWPAIMRNGWQRMALAPSTNIVSKHAPDVQCVHYTRETFLFRFSR
jgi:hypothetical protein